MFTSSQALLHELLVMVAIKLGLPTLEDITVQLVPGESRIKRKKHTMLRFRISGHAITLTAIHAAAAKLEASTSENPLHHKAPIAKCSIDSPMMYKVWR